MSVPGAGSFQASTGSAQRVASQRHFGGDLLLCLAILSFFELDLTTSPDAPPVYTNSAGYVVSSPHPHWRTKCLCWRIDTKQIAKLVKSCYENGADSHCDGAESHDNGADSHHGSAISHHGSADSHSPITETTTETPTETPNRTPPPPGAEPEVDREVDQVTKRLKA